MSRIRRCAVVALLAATLAIDATAAPAVEPPGVDHCRAGWEAFQKERYFVAIGHLDSCLDRPLPPGVKAMALRMRAKSFAGLGRYEKALDDQRKSLGLEAPKDVWPLVMLSVYHRHLKQFDQALAALRDARTYDEDGPGTGPGMAVAYHTGWALHDAGRYAEAVEAYSEGIPKQPDYGYALYRRALAYEALGDKVQAQRDLFRAAELTPRDGYDAEVTSKFAEYGLNAAPARPAP